MRNPANSERASFRSRLRTVSLWLFRYTPALLAAALAPYSVGPLLVVPVFIVSVGGQMLSRRTSGRTATIFLACSLLTCWLAIFLAVANVLRLFSPVWPAFAIVPLALVGLVWRGFPNGYAILVGWAAIGLRFADDYQTHWSFFCVVISVIVAVRLFPFVVLVTNRFRRSVKAPGLPIKFAILAVWALIGMALAHDEKSWLLFIALTSMFVARRAIPVAVRLAGRLWEIAQAFRLPDGCAILVVWAAIGWWVVGDEIYSHRLVFGALTLLFATGGVFTMGVRPELRLSEIALTLTIATVFVRMLTFYVAYEDRSYERVVAQQGVKGVFRFARSDAVGRELMDPWSVTRIPRVTWIQESCDGSGLYAGTYKVGYPQASHLPALARIDRTDRTLRKSNLIGTANDRPLLDCEKKTLWIGTLGQHGQLHRFADGQIEAPVESYTIRRPLGSSRATADSPIEPLWLEPDEEGRKLYIGDDQGLTTRGGVYEIPFPPDGSRATLLSDEGIYFVVWHDEVKGVRRSGCSLDSRRGTELWTEFSESIFVSDASSGEKLNSRSVGGGFRFLRYSARWDFLLAVDYARGDLYVLDPVTLETRRMLYVGRGGKWITLSPDEARAYVATQSGAFELDLGTLAAPSTEGRSSDRAPAGQEPVER